MKADTIIKAEGYNVLFEVMDIVEAERFVTLIKRENFDYTLWRRNLWEDQTIEELSSQAMKFYNKNNTSTSSS